MSVPLGSPWTSSAAARSAWSALVGVGVTVIGLWEALVFSGGDPHLGDRVVVALLMGVAAGCYRVLPSAGLALVWVASAYQLDHTLTVALVQLAVMIVAYGTSRYGAPATVWSGGLSIPLGSAIALWYVFNHGTEVLGGISTGLNLTARRPATTTAFLLAFIVFAAPWMLGLLLRVTAQFQHAAAERERANVEAARSHEIARLREEQNRLARDVHDVVGHSLAVIVAQADAAQYMDDSEVDRIRAALSNISTSARKSLGDVRQVLSSSVDAADQSPGAVGDLDGLVEGVRGAGNEITSVTTGAERPLPPELDVVAFRVLQEMLTNAIKHGSREAPIEVRRAWGEDELLIEVVNVIEPVEATGPESVGDAEGLGLIGMRRRLDAVGGRLETRTVAGDGAPRFVSLARVPLRDRRAAR